MLLVNNHYAITILFLFSFSILSSIGAIEGGDVLVDVGELFHDESDACDDEIESRSWFETLSFVGLIVCACDIMFRAAWNLDQQRRGVFELTPEKIKQLTEVLGAVETLTDAVASTKEDLQLLADRVTELKHLELGTQKREILDAKGLIVARISNLEMQQQILAEQLIRLDNSE